MESVLLRSKKLISIILLFAAFFCAFWNVKNDVQAIDFKQEISGVNYQVISKQLTSGLEQRVVSKGSISKINQSVDPKGSIFEINQSVVPRQLTSELDCVVKELNSVSIPPVVSKQAIPFMDYQHRYDISVFSYISIIDELTIPVYRFTVLKQSITRKTHFELLNVYILLTFLVLLAAFAGQLFFECFSQKKNSLRYIIQYIHNLDGQK